MDVNSTTPENTHVIGAQDIFKHRNYCCSIETENITLNVVVVNVV